MSNYEVCLTVMEIDVIFALLKQGIPSRVQRIIGQGPMMLPANMGSLGNEVSSVGLRINQGFPSLTSNASFSKTTASRYAT